MALSRPHRTFARVLAVLAGMLLTVDVCHAGRTTTTYTMTYAGSLVARSALLILKQGDTVSVTATGVIDSNQHDAYNPWNGPEGLSNYHPAAPIPTAPHNSLIAYLGTEHTPIHVGANGTFIAPHDGELKFGANDHFPQDNQGAWTITYSVTAASPQTISITPLPNPAILGSTHSLNAIASPSMLPVMFAAWDGCTVDEHGVVTFTRIGSCLIIASQPGDYDHLPAAPHEFATSVVKKPQTVTFTTAPPLSPVVGDRYSPAAVATSGGEVIFNTNGDCSFTDSGAVEFLAIGHCDISAYQPGDHTEWNYSEEVIQRIVIGKGLKSQSITFTSTAPLDPAPGTRYSPTAVASSALPVTFSVAGPCSLSAQYVTLDRQGTCTITASQTGDANYAAAEPKAQSILIAPSKTTQTVHFTSTPPDEPPPDSTYSVAATATSSLPVTFSVRGPCSLLDDTVHFIGEGTCLITADQPGNDVFEPASPTTQTIAIGRTQATLLLTATPAAAREGEPITLTATLAQSADAGTVSFTHNDAALCPDVTLDTDTATCSVAFETAGRYTVSAIYTGSATNTPASASPVAILVSAPFPPANVQAATSFLRHRNNMLLAADVIGTRPRDTLRLHQQEQTLSTSFATQENSPAISSFLAAQTINLSRMTFSATLNDLRNVFEERDAHHTQAARDSLGYADHWRTHTRPALSRYNAWMSAHASSFSHSDNEATDNNAAVAAIGVDVLLTPTLLTGVFIQADAMRSDGASAHVEGYGGLVGPYLAVALGSNLTWQAHAGWGLSTNTLNGDSDSNAFTTQRWIVATSLTGLVQHGAWSLIPEARVSYISDHADKSDALPSLRNAMGQAKAGPRISYRHVTQNGASLEPFAGLRVTWTFVDETAANGVILSPSEDFGPSGIRGEAEFGINAVYPDGVSWGLRGAYDGIGSDTYGAMNGSALLSIPF